MSSRSSPSSSTTRLRARNTQIFTFESQNFFDYQMNVNGELVTRSRYSTDLLADEAQDYIRAHRDEPFFLLIQLLDPHWPYAPPA